MAPPCRDNGLGVASSKPSQGSASLTPCGPLNFALIPGIPAMRSAGLTWPSRRRPLPAMLRVRYRIEGDVARIRLPPVGPARRCDGLWHHSCLEAFLRPDGNDSYHEFNFAPSGDWAAYRFGGRRSARSSPELPAPPVQSHAPCGLIRSDRGHRHRRLPRARARARDPSRGRRGHRDDGGRSLLLGAHAWGSEARLPRPGDLSDFRGAPV